MFNVQFFGFIAAVILMIILIAGSCKGSGNDPSPVPTETSSAPDITPGAEPITDAPSGSESPSPETTPAPHDYAAVVPHDSAKASVHGLVTELMVNGSLRNRTVPVLSS